MRPRSALSPAFMVTQARPWLGALALALACSGVQAAQLGHSRLVSRLGQPLRADVQINQLSQDASRHLTVQLAPLDEWKRAGLEPPVSLGSIQLRIADGYTPGTKVVHLSSSQTFDKPVADLLLDVTTPAGRQRYQVSLLTLGMPAATNPAAQYEAGRRIRVEQGDTMVGIAEHNAVQGVTAYQLMIALQRANPKSFIHDNLNLVKAGATLVMPSYASLTAISDREARRIFMEQARAFALYRQKAAGATTVVERDATSGAVSEGADKPAARGEPAAQDRLELSGAAGSEDNDAATHKNIQESVDRVSQLEENVRHLDQALQAQGGAASSLVAEGAKSLGNTLADAFTGGAGDTDEGQAGKGANAAASGGAEASAAVDGTGAASTTGDARAAKKVESGAGRQGAADDARTYDDTLHSGTPNGGTPNGGTPNGGTPNGSTPNSGTPNDGAMNDGATNGGAAIGGSAAQGNGSGATTGANAANGGGASLNGTDAAAADAAAASGNALPADKAANGTAGSDNTVAQTSAGQGSGGTAEAPPAQAESASQAGSSSASPAGKEGDAQSSSRDAGDKTQESTSSGTENQATRKQQDGQVGPGGAPGRQGAGGQAGAESNSSHSNGADTKVSWLQEHLLGTLTGILALIVLIVAWLLRRANAARGDGRDGVITEAMVQEKLDQINLDLSESSPPESDRSPKH
ncbi:hypothetical protein ERD78_08430 [Allopusillimonas soli]|uniref:FimV N-terminal domain-containing protein n=1 Tax=Allopusillimonas soli TaxID=659016 RepID=A0A853FFV8_9BURK|nr:FimV/HubP family polar landmark protein [Allopusillimonas soli]NYT36896.1 hypothetical protein [Allopusillimonas soli]TEA75354.1 hypothetical protein ERD78_08430 [Allopusillimonas soli]